MGSVTASMLFDWYFNGDTPSQVFDGFRLSEASARVFDGLAAGSGVSLARPQHVRRFRLDRRRDAASDGTAGGAQPSTAAGRVERRAADR